MTIYRKPLTFGMMANVLGTAPMIEYICKSASINPMAKYKPIRHRTNGPITEAERRGESADISVGIIYGLNASPLSNNPYYAHTATWGYDGRPYGGIGEAPYRLLDFDGYDTNAVPAMEAEGIYTEAYYNADYPFTVTLFRRNGNTTGVNPIEMCWGAGAGVAEQSQTYMYAVVDNYMRMMTPRKGEVIPIYANSTEYNTFYCPKLPNNLQGNATRTVTIMIGPYWAEAANSWYALTNDKVFGVSGRFITFPELAGKSVVFKELITQTIVFTNMSAYPINGTSMDSTITYSWNQGTSWSSVANKRIVVDTYRVEGNKKYLVNTHIITGLSGDSVSVYYSDLTGDYFPNFGENLKFEALFQFTLNGSTWETQMEGGRDRITTTKQY